MLDVEPIARACKAFSLNEKLKKDDFLAYELWEYSHSCNFNYRSSAENGNSRCQAYLEAINLKKPVYITLNFTVTGSVKVSSVFVMFIL